MVAKQRSNCSLIRSQSQVFVQSEFRAGTVSFKGCKEIAF